MFKQMLEFSSYLIKIKTQQPGSVVTANSLILQIFTIFSSAFSLISVLKHNNPITRNWVHMTEGEMFLAINMKKI